MGISPFDVAMTSLVMSAGGTFLMLLVLSPFAKGGASFDTGGCVISESLQGLSIGDTCVMQPWDRRKCPD